MNHRITISWENTTGLIRFKKDYLISANFCQMSLLLLFNSTNKMVVSEIAKRLNLTNDTIKMLLSGIIHRESISAENRPA